MDSPQPRGSDPTQWVQRRTDPLLLEVNRVVKLWPAVLALWTLVMGAGSVGAWWSLMRANQVTKVQFEAEQEERRAIQLEIAKLGQAVKDLQHSVDQFHERAKHDRSH